MSAKCSSASTNKTRTLQVVCTSATMVEQGAMFEITTATVEASDCGETSASGASGPSESGNDALVAAKEQAAARLIATTFCAQTRSCVDIWANLWFHEPPWRSVVPAAGEHFSQPSKIRSLTDLLAEWVSVHEKP